MPAGALPRRSRAFSAMAGDTSAAVTWPVWPTAARAASAEIPRARRDVKDAHTWRNVSGSVCFRIRNAKGSGSPLSEMAAQIHQQSNQLAHLTARHAVDDSPAEPSQRLQPCGAARTFHPESRSSRRASCVVVVSVGVTMHQFDELVPAHVRVVHLVPEIVWQPGQSFFAHNTISTVINRRDTLSPRWSSRSLARAWRPSGQYRRCCVRRGHLLQRRPHMEK